jgi:hypothetical protein
MGLLFLSQEVQPVERRQALQPPPPPYTIITSARCVRSGSCVWVCVVLGHLIVAAHGFAISLEPEMIVA